MYFILVCFLTYHIHIHIIKQCVIICIQCITILSSKSNVILPRILIWVHNLST